MFDRPKYVRFSISADVSEAIRAMRIRNDAAQRKARRNLDFHCFDPNQSVWRCEKVRAMVQ